MRLVGLLTDGHILLEGVPGLAKTTAIKSLAKALSTSFQRIQFTPDLLPADLIGTMIYMPGDGTFKTRKGPIFGGGGARLGRSGGPHGRQLPCCLARHQLDKN